MPDMFCLVLAEPRERLSSTLNLAPGRESTQAGSGSFEENYMHGNEVCRFEGLFNRCIRKLCSESPCWCSDRKASGTWEGDQSGDSQFQAGMRGEKQTPAAREQQTSNSSM